MKTLKRLLIVAVVLFFVALGFLPVITSKMADNAFDDPKHAESPELLKKAIKWKMRLFMFSHARPIAEKAIITYPDNREYLPTYIYNAAVCGNKEGKPEVAVHWYCKFLKNFPKHMWADQAKQQVNKLAALHNIEVDKDLLSDDGSGDEKKKVKKTSSKKSTSKTSTQKKRKKKKRKKDKK